MYQVRKVMHYVYVLLYRFCLFLWLFDWILELFWQCGVFCFQILLFLKVLSYSSINSYIYRIRVFFSKISFNYIRELLRWVMSSLSNTVSVPIKLCHVNHGDILTIMSLLRGIDTIWTIQLVPLHCVMMMLCPIFWCNFKWHICWSSFNKLRKWG
jgi:hypothetical protein